MADFRLWDFPSSTWVDRNLPVPRLDLLCQDVNKVIWFFQKRKLKRNGKARIALASYPRSGNSWVRYLIETATGEKSGSIYPHDGGVLDRGPECIVIKTHKLDAYRYTRAIHLVRNPFDAIESYYCFRRDVVKKPCGWGECVERGIRDWEKHTSYWFQTNLDILRIRFEDIKSDTLGQLRLLLVWLGSKVTEDVARDAVHRCAIDRLRAMNAHVGKKFFRNGKVGKGIESFDEAQKRFAREQLGHPLERCGYSDVLTTL